VKSGGGDVYIPAQTGVREITGNIIGLGNDYYRAEFVVEGKPNTPFSVVLPNNVNLSGQGNAKVVKLHYWHASNPPTTGPTGKTTLYVGGLLQLHGQDFGGDYEGVFDITVNPLK
jgi:hypothetical protein